MQDNEQQSIATVHSSPASLQRSVPSMHTMFPTPSSPHRPEQQVAPETQLVLAGSHSPKVGEHFP
jgi:hypothetical protein